MAFFAWTRVSGRCLSLQKVLKRIMKNKVAGVWIASSVLTGQLRSVWDFWMIVDHVPICCYNEPSNSHCHRDQFCTPMIEYRILNFVYGVNCRLSMSIIAPLLLDMPDLDHDRLRTTWLGTIPYLYSIFPGWIWWATAELCTILTSSPKHTIPL